MDGSARFRTELSLRLHLCIGSQIRLLRTATQSIKTVAVHSCFFYRLDVKSELLKTTDALRSRSDFRASLNSAQLPSDFAFDATWELLVPRHAAHGETVQRAAATRAAAAAIASLKSTTGDELRSLDGIERRRKGRHLLFFNTPGGTELRFTAGRRAFTEANARSVEVTSCVWRHRRGLRCERASLMMGTGKDSGASFILAKLLLRAASRPRLGLRGRLHWTRHPSQPLRDLL